MSKLTDGFETKVRIARSGHESFVAHDVYELLTHARALEAMLIRHQWQDGYCIQCGENQYDGHSPDCELARLIE